MAALVAVTAAGSASANGRYPYSQQLVVDPSDATRLWQRTTYGALTSSNDGKAWSWLCEQGVGYGTAEDPMFGATATGALLVASVNGMLTTPDHGCSWTTMPDFGKRLINDLAVSSDGNHVVALTTSITTSNAFDLVVYRSDDAGAHFHALGPALSEDIDGLTIEMAASDPMRLYASGVANIGTVPDAGALPGSAVGDAGKGANGVLLRSKDGGATWRRIPVVTASAGQPFIAAVHPTNPDVLYVRVAGPGSDEGQSVQSFLLYSEDGGDHFREVLRESADMLGFALSKDGTTVFAGFGDSYALNGERPVDPSVLGLYRASANDFAFTRTVVGQVGCLFQDTSRLYVCGDHVTSGFELGVSTDDGATVQALYDWGNALQGPLECPASSEVTRTCTPQWPPICDQLGPCSLDAGTASTSGATNSARGGCDCGSPGRSSSSSNDVGSVKLVMPSEPLELLAGLSALGAALWRRRRRR